MSKIDEIKRGLEKNTEEWAKTANQVMKEATNESDKELPLEESRRAQ
jgi:hypothetical protein